jgi:hypothetical protein
MPSSGRAALGGAALPGREGWPAPAISSFAGNQPTLIHEPHIGRRISASGRRSTRRTGFPMNVRPTSTGPASTYGPGTPRRPAGDEDASRTAPDATARPAGDQVELSEAAKKLAAEQGGRIVGSIPHQKMRTALARIAAGYYDRPEVRDQILERLKPELDIES